MCVMMMATQVTNSKLDYTTLLLNHAFGEDWKSCFDIIVVHAQKGRFFEEKSPFKRTPAAVSSFGHGTDC